jgi:hypothetical protein
MVSIRSRASFLARAVLVALALQLAGPLTEFPGHASAWQIAAGLIPVCSEHGLKYLHPDGTPAEESEHPSNPSIGDCCPFGCPMQGMVLPAMAARPAPPIAWTSRYVPIETAGPPDTPFSLAFEARGPPLLT